MRSWIVHFRSDSGALLRFGPNAPSAATPQGQGGQQRQGGQVVVAMRTRSSGKFQRCRLLPAPLPSAI